MARQVANDLRKGTSGGGLAWRKWTPPMTRRAAKLRAVGHSLGVIAGDIGADIDDVRMFLDLHPLGLRAENEMRGRFLVSAA